MPMIVFMFQEHKYNINQAIPVHHFAYDE